MITATGTPIASRWYGRTSRTMTVIASVQMSSASTSTGLLDKPTKPIAAPQMSAPWTGLSQLRTRP